MHKALRWLKFMVLSVTVLTIALYGIARLRGPTEEQKAALALLEVRPPPPGRNAFALVWLMPYDMQETDREQVLAEDVQRFSSAPDPARDGGSAAFTSVASKRYPASREPNRERYCRWREPGCLAKVRADKNAYARLIEADKALLARADTLATYSHLRSPFTARLDMPFPPYQFLSYPMTGHAHAFASGDTEAGLDGACRGTSAARMLIHDGDNLVSAMIGAAMLQGNATLLADMLAELPVDHPLPASCSVAFAPPKQDEFSLCNTVRGEARYMFGTLRQVADSRHPTGTPWQDRLLPVLYDYDKTVARMAPRLAWYCGVQARAAMAADLPTEAPAPTTMSMSSLECFDNFIGCILADTGSVSFDEYQHRLQDAAIRLKTTATLLWLRSHPNGQPLNDQLARRPAALRSPRRELQPEKDGTSVSVELFDGRHGESWTVPNPGSRLRTRSSIGSGRHQQGEGLGL